MKPYYQLQNIKTLLLGSLALLVLASCGSYQYAGYDHDGIYSDGTPVVQKYTEEDQTESYNNALYYQQVFSSQAAQFGTIAQSESAIFTDIDTYSSGSYQEDGYNDDSYPIAHAGWGNQVDEISINIYNRPIGYPGFYSYSPFYDPFFAADFGWGYGYGNPYFDWRWRNYYSPWGYGPHYAGYGSWGYSSWGYGYNYWGHGYRYPYQVFHVIPARNVAYNNSRRNSSIDYNSGNRRSNYLSNAREYRNSDDSGNAYRNPRNVRASSRSNRDYTLSRSTRVSSDTGNRSRTSRVESPQQVRSNRATSTRDYTPAQRTRTDSNNTPQVRSSSTNRNSSGTYRSSTPSTPRSSGTSTSTSRSSRGRGN